MDAEGIKHLQEQAIDAAQGRAAELLQGKQIALPDNYKIHDLEQYQPGRRRFRGTLATDSLSDFVGYVKRRTGADVPSPVPGFIDAERLAATVLFNLGDATHPGHADDRAVLRLKATAPYDALLQIDGSHLQHKAAVEWLEDWNEHLGFLDADGVPVAKAAAMTAVRKITIKAVAESTSSEADYRSTRSAFEDVEARGAAALPAAITFECIPYPGLPYRTFRLRLAVLTTGDKPTLVLRVRNLAAEQEGIAQDFKRILLEDLEAAADLTIGTFTP